MGMSLALPSQDSPVPRVLETTLLALLWSMPDGPEAAEFRVCRLIARRRIRLIGALRGHGRKLVR